MKRRTYFKKRMLVPLMLLMVLSAVAVILISCMPDLPKEEDIVITPPVPDPLPDNKEEETKTWKWHLTGSLPSSLSFQIPEDESGVQILLNGKASKIVCEGDEYVILSERVRMTVKKENGDWIVYLDGSECGYFRYQ